MTVVKAAPPRVCFADLERWPDDGRRYELYDGEVYVVPSPILLHQIVSARLYLALEKYTRTHGGIVLYAPLDIVLTEFDVVQPDLLLFTRDRQQLVTLRAATRRRSCRNSRSRPAISCRTPLRVRRVRLQSL